MYERAFISATLIVRDEAAHLGACLDSISALVEEIVVVDTGSRDTSRSIAAAHGARVFDFPWRGDFSAARNYALDQAAGDWILYIDADERARSYERDILAEELADGGLCAVLVRFYPQSGFTAYPELRLFRRNPRIRFRSAIHETMRPDVDRLVAAGEGCIGISCLTLDHLGYDGDQSAKNRRDLPLLLQQVRIDPGRTYLWWHLGTVYRGLDRADEAETAWWEGVRVARARSRHSGQDVLCFVELAKLRLTRGENALALISEAMVLDRSNWLLQWLEAGALLAADRFAEARSILERLALVDPETLVSDAAYDGRIFGASALGELGGWAFKKGRYRESADWYQRARALAPGRLDLHAKYELAVRRGAVQQ